MRTHPPARPFDTPEREAFRDMVAVFIAREIAPHADAWDEAGDFPWALHEKAGSLGLFGFGIPEDYGGLGFDDALMRYDSATLMGYAGVGGVNASLFSRGIMTGPIVQLASETQKKSALTEIVSGRAGGALAMTEPSGGSDLANLKTKARKKGDKWIIDGEKTFITGGMKASWYRGRRAHGRGRVRRGQPVPRPRRRAGLFAHRDRREDGLVVFRHRHAALRRLRGACGKPAW